MLIIDPAVNFDTPLTASQGYSLAKPFFECPSSNPPIEFTLIPPIVAAFQNGDTPHAPGDVVDISWDSSAIYIGENVHAQFLADIYSIPVPLKQTGDGMGTVTLPKDINGTAIIVLTDFAGVSDHKQCRAQADGFSWVPYLIHYAMASEQLSWRNLRKLDGGLTDV